jgi:hypothetical protein
MKNNLTEIYVFFFSVFQLIMKHILLINLAMLVPILKPTIDCTSSSIQFQSLNAYFDPTKFLFDSTNVYLGQSAHGWNLDIPTRIGHWWSWVEQSLMLWIVLIVAPIFCRFKIRSLGPSVAATLIFEIVLTFKVGLEAFCLTFLDCSRALF